MLAVAFLAASACAAAHALERVTLHNGFSYDCARRETLDATHVRLFLSTTSSSADGSGNFIDLPIEAIAVIETLPEPVAPAIPVAVATPGPPMPDVPTLLSHAGAQHNIDVDLLASVVHAESGGRVDAVSRAGARGLMQLMPGTAQQLGVEDAFRPDQNIAGGSAYLDSLLTRYHDNLALALAAYNAGPGAVDHYRGIPPYRETRAYVARVMTEFKRRKLELAKAHVQSAAQLASR
jgi:soluble lytic murein transglycosylase-like protein